MKFEKKTQLSIAYAVLTLLLLLSLQNYFATQVETLPYSQFREWIKSGQVIECTFSGEFIHGRANVDGQEISFRTAVIDDPELIGLLEEHQVEFTRQPSNNWFTQLLSWILPALIFVGIWLFIIRRMSGGGGLMSIGKSKAKVYMEKGTGITFDDVAGIQEAKEELLEIVEFLRTPERFQALGGRIPRGVLLVGPPGTGKTLLAKAVAGEASVPFFSLSGSDFVEMFVGVGAARVRDLFDQAKKHAPAIIFIDELDALGKARGAGSFGGHDEREQTLNQLLTELDGFRHQRWRDPHGGDQPTGDPRPGLVAPRPFRPHGGCGPARCQGARRHPPDPRQGSQAGPGRRSIQTSRAHAGLCRRGLGQCSKRSGSLGGAAR